MKDIYKYAGDSEEEMQELEENCLEEKPCGNRTLVC
jgi:hypothetical protein